MPKAPSSREASSSRKVSTREVLQIGKPQDNSKKHKSNGAEEDTVVTAAQALDEITVATLETTLGSSWEAALSPEFNKPYFTKLKSFLLAEISLHTIYPPLRDVYSWSRLTPLNTVKVVILGQDPYHDVGQAHGLSFSVVPPTKPPPSLKNIFKQLSTDIPSFVVPASGDLTPLARLGVLWLNTCLTVRAHKASSHSKKGWETFTTEVLRAVIAHREAQKRGVVFMAWGLPAQKACSKLGVDETKHLILKSAHPSPLSAHRGFLGNGHFREANEWLRKQYGEGSEIDWSALSRLPST